MSQAGVQVRSKSLHHHDPKNRDSKHACQARHGVVDSRGGSDSILINRIHNHGGQRSNRDGHSKSENNYRRKEFCPIITPDRGHGEQSETQSDNERADDQRSPCTVAGDKSARPAREREHKQNHGKDRSAGCGRGVALDLNQIQRKQEEENSGSGVQKERKQVCAAEASGFEQRKRERRRGAVVLDKYEGNKTADAKNQTPEDQRTSPTQIKRFDETDNHTSKSQGRKNRTWPVDAPGAGAAALRNPPKRNRHHCGGDGYIEEKHPPPGNVLDEPASKHWADSGSDRRETRPCTDRRAATSLVERRADDCQTAGHEESSSYTLNAPRDNQLRNI